MVDFAAGADRIAHRIAKLAVWRGTACSWSASTPPLGGASNGSNYADAEGASLYHGSAGIGLFLAEVSRVSSSKLARKCAAGAVEHARQSASRMPKVSFGFYTGRIGVAYVLARAGRLLERGDWCSSALELIASMRGLEMRDDKLDVISGAAGAILALLSEALEGDDSLEVATALGDRLLDTMIYEPIGCSWRTKGWNTRNLTGYGHGASGIGLALLRLSAVTGERRYRYAADQAFTYERRFYSPERRNWPDFRDRGLSIALDDQPQAVLDRLRRGDRWPDPKPSWMTAWCHGAAGIGLARMEALELSEDCVWRQEAEAATSTVLAALESDRRFALCHGVLGNAEVLRAAARVLGRTELEDCVRDRAAVAWKQYESAGRPWPSGGPGGAPDPSLMIGDAGIGLFYLRLADAAVPSVLAPPMSVHCATAPEPCADLRNDHITLYFRRSTELLRGVDTGSDRTTPLSAVIGSTLTHTAEAIAAIVQNGGADADPASLHEIEVDCAAYEFALQPLNLAVEHLQLVIASELNQVAWKDVLYRLSPRCRLLFRNHGESILFLRRAEAVIRLPLSASVAAIFAAIDEAAPATMASIVRRFSEVSGLRCQQPVLEAAIEGQLRFGVRAGAIQVLLPTTGAPGK